MLPKTKAPWESKMMPFTFAFTPSQDANNNFVPSWDYNPYHYLFTLVPGISVFALSRYAFCKPVVTADLAGECLEQWWQIYGTGATHGMPHPSRWHTRGCPILVPDSWRSRVCCCVGGQGVPGPSL